MKGLFTPIDRETRTDSKYTGKIKVPQYTPSTKLPSLESLTNTTKYGKLVRDIKNSSVPEDVKNFLLLAATRHIVFNYAKIADYYAHSDKEVQRLMEQSALVILDVNDAIANGYLKLSKNIREMLEDSEDDE